MAVHIYLGDNGVGKTRYLQKLARKCIKEGKRLVSNFDNFLIYNEIDYKKVDAMENGVSPFDDLNSRAWNIHMRDYILSKYVNMVLLKGDVLILDELDSFLPIQKVINLCNVINDVKDLWEDIHISGHMSYLLNASIEPITHILLKDKDELVFFGDEVYKYRDLF